jgi:hydroxymethylpyrimidine/phosphomethylpyrimidine kinase
VKTPPVVMTIAGSDSGGGAGIQADLHTFARLGCWGTSAITCLTAQNPDGVSRVDAVDPEMVAEQIRMVAARFPLRAVKVGMSYSGPIVEAIAGALQEHAQRIPLVLDPVMRATSGASLLRDDGESSLIRSLLPLATVVTPNLAEAEVLAGTPAITTLEEMEEAARRIQERTRGAVLVKGGHLDHDATDVLLWNGRLLRLTSERIDTRFTHGTGCSLSAAIAAGLASGRDLAGAVRSAKEYVTDLLRHAVRLGDERLGGLGFVEVFRPRATIPAMTPVDDLKARD